MRPSAAAFWARLTRYAVWRIFSASDSVWPEPTLIVVGLVRWAPTMRVIRGGMVALNSTVCRVAGVRLRIVSMSSANPMSSISSASSSTTISSALTLRVRRVR